MGDSRSRPRHFDITFSVDPRAVTPDFMFRAIAKPLVLHPHGWVRKGYRFNITRNKKQPKPVIAIKLCPQSVLDSLFPQFATQKLSICNMLTREIFINEDRWYRKYEDKSEMSLPAYRLYVLQHEIGHALGFHHESCKGEGLRAPIMLQQTLGLNSCLPFPFP